MSTLEEFANPYQLLKLIQIHYILLIIFKRLGVLDTDCPRNNYFIDYNR